MLALGIGGEDEDLGLDIGGQIVKGVLVLIEEFLVFAGLVEDAEEADLGDRFPLADFRDGERFVEIGGAFVGLVEIDIRGGRPLPAPRL